MEENGGAMTGGPIVRQFRQILIWPLQLMPLNASETMQNHWELLESEADGGVWRELEDEFPQDAGQYQERHYREFVSFLPHVQRFLYGERASLSGRTTYGESPLRIFRRSDVKRVRVRFRGDPAPLTLEVAHADLYFFFDVDVVISVVEISAENLPFGRAQELIYRFGRAYPAGWTEEDAAANCLEEVAWLDADGRTLSTSDYGAREKFMASVCRHQTTDIAAHWEFLLAPMILNQRERRGAVRFRQLEFHRMPLMAYLAVDDPSALTRADYVRLAFASAPGDCSELPSGHAFLDDFEARYCYDRFYDPSRKGDWANTRLLCSGQAFVAVGDAGKRMFTDSERGFLAQFRHQFFLVGLIAHFHRAALLMMSDRLVATMSRLNRSERESVSRFRRDIRVMLETFLRFTHRYYFSEISDQLPMRDIFRRWVGHLGTERLYDELRDEISDMASYLETDLLRRQAVTILQLTVATLFSLIGTVTTGFLGMNLFSHADLPALDRFEIFLAVVIPTTLVTLYTVMKSRRLAFFLDALADERLSLKGKVRAFAGVWGRG
jgi:hypothetical protein